MDQVSPRPHKAGQRVASHAIRPAARYQWWTLKGEENWHRGIGRSAKTPRPPAARGAQSPYFDGTKAKRQKTQAEEEYEDFEYDDGDDGDDQEAEEAEEAEEAVEEEAAEEEASRKRPRKLSRRKLSRRK